MRRSKGPETLTAARIIPSWTTGALTEATPASRSSTLSNHVRRRFGTDSAA